MIGIPFLWIVHVISKLVYYIIKMRDSRGLN